jgi:transposase
MTRFSIPRSAASGLEPDGLAGVPRPKRRASVRARFGFAVAAGSLDDPRVRWITQYLPREMARELFAARDAGAGEQQQLVILARALGICLLPRWGPPRPRSAYRLQRPRVRRLLDRMSLPFRSDASGRSAPRGPGAYGRSYFGGPQAAGAGAAWPSRSRAAGVHGCLARRTIPQFAGRGRRPERPCSFDRAAYRRRNVIERCFHCLEQWRGIATRFEAQPGRCLAAITLASTLIWLGTGSTRHYPGRAAQPLWTSCRPWPCLQHGAPSRDRS